MADVNKVGRNVLKMIDQGASEEDIDAYLKSEGYTPDQLRKNRGFTKIDPLEGVGGMEKFRAGWGKNVADTAFGVQQAVTEAAAQPGRLIPGTPFGPLTTRFHGKAEELRKEQDVRKKLDERLMQDPAASTGYFAGSFLPSLAMGSALGGTKAGELLFAPRNVLQAAGQGALTGLIQPVGTEDSRTVNALKGSGFSTAGYGIGRAFSGLPTSKEAKALMKEGIIPSPGQAMPKTRLGDIARKAEERAGTAILFGEPIQHARNRAQEELISAGMRRAGGTGEIGQMAVGDLQEKLGTRFDSIGKKLGTLVPDEQLYKDLSKANLADDLSNVVTGGRSRPTFAGGGKYEGAVRQGNLNGDSLMSIRSSWMQKLRSLAPATDEAAITKKENLRDAIESIDTFIERAAPSGVAKDYAGLRNLYRNLAVMETAGVKAAGRKAAPGIPTPSMLMQSVKENARSSGTLPRKALAAGKANMQDLATLGMSLGDTIPNSGTAERLAMAALIGGGLAGTYYENPLIPLAMTGATLGTYGLRPVTKAMLGGYRPQQDLLNMNFPGILSRAAIAEANMPRGK